MIWYPEFDSKQYRKGEQGIYLKKVKANIQNT